MADFMERTELGLIMVQPTGRSRRSAKKKARKRRKRARLKVTTGEEIGEDLQEAQLDEEEDEDDDEEEESSCFEEGKGIFVIFALLLIVGCLIAIVILVRMILPGKVILPATRHSRSTVCEEAVCVTKAKSILANMKRDVAPCDDFFQHACGNFKGFEGVFIGQSQDAVEKFLIDRINKQVIAPTHMLEPVRFVEKFYRKCLTAPDSAAESNRTLLQVLEKNMNDLDIQDLTIFTLKNGLPSIMSIRVDFDEEQQLNSKTQVPFVITVSAPNRPFDIQAKYHTQEIDDSIKSAYKEFIATIHDAFGVVDHISERQDDCIELESLLSLTVNESSKHPSSLRLTKKQLTDNRIFGEFNLVKVIDGIFQGNKYFDVNNNYEVIIENELYFKKLAEWFSTLIKANNLRRYLTWKMLQNFGRILFVEFHDSESKFVQAFKRAGLAVQEERADMDPRLMDIRCLEFIHDAAPLILGRMMYDEIKIPPETSNGLHALFKRVQSRMIKSFQSPGSIFSSIHSNEKVANEQGNILTTVRAIIRRMQLRLGYPEWIKDNAKFTTAYDGLKFYPTEAILEMALKLRSKTFEMETFKRFEVNDRDIGDWWPSSPVEVKSRYFPIPNILVVPAAALIKGCYNQLLPKYINYGVLGSFFAREMIHAIEIVIENGWSREAKQEYKKRKMAMLGVLNVSLTQNQKESFIKEIIVDLGAIKRAYSSYNLANFREKDLYLPGLKNQTAKEIFFLSYANIFCSAADPFYKNFYENRKNPKDQFADLRYRVLWSLMNFEGFSDTFNCAKGSPMNPEVKYGVW